MISPTETDKIIEKVILEGKDSLMPNEFNADDLKLAIQLTQKAERQKVLNNIKELKNILSDEILSFKYLKMWEKELGGDGA